MCNEKFRLTHCALLKIRLCPTYRPKVELCKDQLFILTRAVAVWNVEGSRTKLNYIPTVLRVNYPYGTVYSSTCLNYFFLFVTCVVNFKYELRLRA